ncbi:MAG: hypothetical protein J5662_01360 [Clostridia bacterium]|nr:hypothetical protein [Clostridia bacterium]
MLVSLCVSPFLLSTEDVVVSVLVFGTDIVICEAVSGCEAVSVTGAVDFVSSSVDTVCVSAAVCSSVFCEVTSD